MGISFKIYEKQRFFISIWSDTVSDSDLLSSYKLLLENEKFKPGFNEIVDMRNAQLGGVTGGGLFRLNSMVEGFLSGKCEKFKTAVVASEDLHTEITRIYKCISIESAENVMVYGELKEALKWIGVDESFLG